MRSLSKACLLSLVALAALGCSDDSNNPGGPGDPVGPGELTQADITGTWNITRLEFREHAPGDREFDVVADGGGTATMTIAANGDYTLVISDDEGEETQTGNFEVTENGVLDTGEGNESGSSWEFTLDGDTIAAETTDGEFDFDLDGSEPEAADVSVTLQKVS